ncbi:MAG: AraC family transcriptional regulator [Clostridia bacterium]|nr:AraC family transcriptional regulator [Clostridia bacterium]
MKLTDGWNLCGIKILDEKMKKLPIYFHSIGHYAGQKHVFRPDGLGQYQICICTRGSGTFNAEGKEYSIEKGDVFFLSPDSGHEYYPRDNDWTIIWVVFNGINVEGFCSYLGFEDSFVCKAENDNLEKMVSLCEKIYETYNKNECYEFSLTTEMLNLLECLSMCKKRDKYSSKDAEGGGFAPAIDYIKKYYMDFISLDDIAKASGLSKSHFCRQFKEFYNVTPMVYLNRYRISVAKFLLTTTMESIDVIAGKTGFSDTSYFCAVFKKFENYSPAQYRSRHNEQ